MFAVYYVTNDKNPAISWMTPAQTACKNLHYLFTQCEDIACRAVAPMQDTPSNKITYDAHVTVQKNYTVKMSANETRNATEHGDFKTFHFYNQIPISSYLIAIAVGELEYRSLGHRVGVITEPCRIDAVAWELEELETFVDKAEGYLTPYIWGHYTILILPPSFPMGGMENPLLTFASPTIITGDKSQVDVAIHEIAHSWTGNDVTCENWSNMWLNEGFTVFEERKVSAILHDENFSKVNAYLGNISATSDMLGYGMNNSFSSLYPILTGGEKPDDSFSTVPYEKGFQLLYYLESLIGPESMQELLRTHVLAHSLTSIGYETFQKHFEDFVDEKFRDTEVAGFIKSKMDWHAWVRQPGLAPVHLDFTTPALNESQGLANEYIRLNGTGSPSNYTDYINNYYSSLRVIFLQQLVARESEVTLEIMSKVDQDLNVTLTLDPECKAIWLPLAIRKNYTDAIEVAHSFISTQGRQKYLSPIYQALLDSHQRDVAIQWFRENEDFYHPYSVEKLKKMIGITYIDLVEKIDLIEKFLE